MLEMEVHRRRWGAVVKRDLLPLAVVVGGVMYKAGEVIIPLYFILTCPCPGKIWQHAWEQRKELRTDHVDK